MEQGRKDVPQCCGYIGSTSALRGKEIQEKQGNIDFGPKIRRGSNGRTIYLGQIGKYVLPGRDSEIQGRILSNLLVSNIAEPDLPLNLWSF